MCPSLRHFKLPILYNYSSELITLSPEIGIERLLHLVHTTGVQVFSIDYRLARKHRYPTALGDMWTPLNWLHSSSDALSINLKRIAVIGENAGVDLAAAVII